MMRVVVDCRIEPGRFGGIEQAMRGLVSGLARTDDEHVDVRVLSWQGMDAWAHASAEDASHVNIESIPPPTSRGLVRQVRSHAIGRRLLDYTQDLRSRHRGVPRSDGVIESLEPDVVHFPHQGAALTSAQSIYEPWDLQHVHLPELFTMAEYLRRERWYRAFCEQAAQVVVHSSSVRRDVIERYGIDAGRVRVLPMGSALELVGELDRHASTRRRHELGAPPRYALYPAQSWPHKNHRRLLEAVAQLRSAGCVVPVVLAGATNAMSELDAVARDLGVRDLVYLPGRVSDLDLRALYDGATCLVYPSRHEGFGLPLVEAFGAAVPVVCSSIDTLREVAGEAAEFVDPLDTEAIAAGIRRVWTDADRADELVSLGAARRTHFTWEATGAAYRSLYAAATVPELVR